MLVKEGDSRTIDIDVRLALPLAAVAGAINAAAFRAVGFFSANMTGNVSLFSDYTAVGSLSFALTFLVIVATFILGAFSSTLLIQAGRRGAIRGVFAYSILVEGCLLAVLGAVDVLVPALHTTPLLVIGLAFLMGLQNAATTLISNARVRTTHVSGIVTDLGIELAMLAEPGGDTDKPAIRSRFRLHAMTLLAFLLGGVAGVVGYVLVGGFVFAIASIIPIAIALPFVRHVANRTGA